MLGASDDLTDSPDADPHLKVILAAQARLDPTCFGDPCGPKPAQVILCVVGGVFRGPFVVMAAVQGVVFEF